MDGSSVYSDIHGREIRLEQHSFSDTCREFTVTRPKTSLRSLTGFTCAVWVVAYGVFVLVEHTAVLSAAIMCTILGLLLHLHLLKVDEESLLVLGSLGVQRSRTFASGRESAVFVEMCRVHDVIINEVISMCKVHYCLCILLRDPAHPQRPSQLMPVFQDPQPRLDCLQEIYRSCQEILAERNRTQDVSMVTPARNKDGCL